ncbi:MAG: hypothetical protein HZA50_02995 [Planctomycetes bacterium]|nr:hypothetical protein [Planctomycetota bacterium]
MEKNILLLCAAFAVFGCDNTPTNPATVPSSAQDTQPAAIPTFEDVDQILVFTSNIWSLSIRFNKSGVTDDSGQVGFSSSDFANFPSGTFDLKKLYTDLSARCVPKATGSAIIMVEFRRKDRKISPMPLYLTDSEYVRGLFKTAIDAAEKKETITGNKIDELAQTHPPIPPPPESQPTTFPAFEDVERFFITASTAWYLDIRIKKFGENDGSGQIVYGSSDCATVPAGTFDLRKLYDDLSARCVPKASDTTIYYFGITYKGKKQSPWYFSDSDYVRWIFKTAIDATAKMKTGSGKTIEELAEKYPPVPPSKEKK